MKELKISSNRVKKVVEEESKQKIFEVLKNLVKDEGLKNLRFGQLIVNLMSFARDIEEVNSNQSFEGSLFYINDEKFIKIANEWLNSKNCCSQDKLVFSGEKIENEWVYACSDCKKEGTVKLEKGPANINRKLYLKTVHENHPKSESIPPLLKRVQ